MSGHTRSPLAVLTYITKQSAQKTWRRGRRDKKVMEMQETSHTLTHMQSLLAAHLQIKS